MGKHYCCVPGCSKHTGSRKKNGEKISFHRIPHNPDIRNLWMGMIKRKTWNPTSYTRVCSEHFKGKMGPTKENPVPTIFPRKYKPGVKDRSDREHAESRVFLVDRGHSGGCDQEVTASMTEKSTAQQSVLSKHGKPYPEGLKCCIPGCDADEKKKASPFKYPWMSLVSFHQPEANHQLLVASWAKTFAEDKNWKPPPHSVVCSLHFKGGQGPLETNKFPSLGRCGHCPETELDGSNEFKVNGFSEWFTKQLYRMWLSGIYCDVNIQTRDGICKAHRFVLASQSSALASAFESLKNSSSTVLDIDVSLDVMMEVLKFTYTGSIGLTARNIQAVYDCAKKLGMKMLLDTCLGAKDRIPGVQLKLRERWKTNKHVIDINDQESVKLLKIRESERCVQTAAKTCEDHTTVTIGEPLEPYNGDSLSSNIRPNALQWITTADGTLVKTEDCSSTSVEESRDALCTSGISDEPHIVDSSPNTVIFSPATDNTETCKSSKEEKNDHMDGNLFTKPLPLPAPNFAGMTLGHLETSFSTVHMGAASLCDKPIVDGQEFVNIKAEPPDQGYEGQHFEESAMDTDHRPQEYRTQQQKADSIP